MRAAMIQVKKVLSKQPNRAIERIFDSIFNEMDKEIEIRDAIPGDASLIRELAEATWWPTYGAIISAGQIRYMLDVIFNDDALRSMLTHREQEFIILEQDGRALGFAAFAPRPEESHVYKLHKLYVRPECHGKSFGRKLLDEVSLRLSRRNIRLLDLNVNRQNPAYGFYLHYGFKVIRQEDVPIGPYWMNDYVMRLDIAPEVVA